jgi:hypothetical protein
MGGFTGGGGGGGEVNPPPPFPYNLSNTSYIKSVHLHQNFASPLLFCMWNI